MKKKLIHGFLMAAVIVVSIGSFVSCTDREEDRLQELQQSLLRDTVFVHQVLTEQIDSLEALKKRMDELEAKCKANCQAVKDELAKYVKVADFDVAMLNINNKFENYYTKTEVQNEITNYFTTHIADYYTKTEINNLFTTKLANYYTKEELDALLSTKLADYYTKLEIDGKLGDYYNKSEIDTKLADYYTKDQVYTKQEIINLFTTYLNDYYKKSETYSKDEVNTLFAQQKDYIDNAIKDFVKEADVIAIVLREIQDANSDIYKAIHSDVVTTLHSEKFGTTTSLTADQMADLLKTLETTLGTVQANATEALNWVNANKDAFETLKQDVQNLKENVAEKSVVEALQQTVAGIQANLDLLLNRIVAAETKAEAAKAQALANKTAIDSLKHLTDSLGDLIKANNTDLLAEINQMKADAQALEDKVNQNKATADGYYNELKQLIQDKTVEVAQKLQNTDQRLSDLDEAYKAADEALSDRIDELDDKVAALQNDMAEVKEKLTDLTEVVKTHMENLITSVIIQGAANPIFGELVLPTGMQTNVLAARYGYAKGAVTFPSRTYSAYASEADYDRVTAEDMTAMLGSGESFESITLTKDQLLMEEGEDNAGKVYVTVNPNTVNFEGVQFSLVNSQDKESGIKIGELKKSDHLLTYGYNYTRAANNGFYEANAQLVNPNNALPRVDTESAKDAAAAVKDILNKKGSLSQNATTFAAGVAKTLASISLDRYGLKATWTDKDVNGNDVEHSTYSDYNIAAVAVRGLPYSFANSYDFDHIPGLDRIENLIGRVIGRIKAEIPGQININISELNIESIKMVDFDELKGDGKFIITIPIHEIALKAGETVKMEDVVIHIPGHYDNEKVWHDGYDMHIGEFVVKENYYVEFTVTVNIEDKIKAIYDELEKPMGAVEDIIKDVNNYIADVKDLVNQINSITASLSDRLDNIQNKIANYLDKLDEKFVKYLTPNKLLQPLLLANTKNGVARLSQTKELPTRIGTNQFTLVATSWTGELLAPAYKKFVGVTNVYDSQNYNYNAQETTGVDCREALNAVNKGDLRKVIDGNQHKITFKADPKYNGRGLVYELLYMGLDFNGKIATQKYYVLVP